MNPIEMLTRDYGLTHQEMAQLTGTNRSSLTKMLTHQRRTDNQTFAVCLSILEKMDAAKEGSATRPGPYTIAAPEWLEQEKLKMDVWQMQLSRLLGRMEKMQKQAGFWAAICHGGLELACKPEWLQRHREEKRAMMQKCWLNEYLPLLTRLRQSEARVAAWQEACTIFCI
jgi:hypothetical protein